MSSLKARLARLPTCPGAGPPRPSGPPASASGASTAASVASPAEARRAKLDELRERMVRILDRSGAPVPAPAPPRRDPRAFLATFDEEPTAAGPLLVRRRRYGPAARVGRAGLFAAKEGNRELLSLLALDPVLASCEPRGALYLDTETTGLMGGAGTVPFLVGLAFHDAVEDVFVLEQVFVPGLGDEAPVLAHVAARLAAAASVVTYNGKSFDLPLLRARCVMNRRPALPERPHLDLLHVARRIHGRRLADRSLVAVENHVLGIERVGDVPGCEIAARYGHWLRSGDGEPLEGVFEHNGLDVLSMIALVGLYGEPLGEAPLVGEDLAGVATTLGRAGAFDQALGFAAEALARGGGAAAGRAAGHLHKARGDKVRALAAFESVAGQVDDPAVRLELAKLYEHHARALEKALAVVALGTGEEGAAEAKRRDRLERKLDRARAAVAPGRRPRRRV